MIKVYFDSEYLFTVDEDAFDPPPKVKSGVIRLVRNNRKELPVPFSYFKSVVKAGFNQRRKTMRNSLSAFLNDELKAELSETLSLRPEQLGCEEFLELAVKLNAHT
ncbi:MAG: 16S rRNA (adenine1518-N6/adenine1519-N6)-dimethyltransferase [Cryomorphaceae bacterium]